MQTFKKIFCSILVTVVVFALVSVAVIEPCLNSECAYFLDKNLRNQLAGQIDCISIGASHGLCGISTAVVDEELECFSYNLSGGMMTLDNKYYLLKKELARNPVDTVILELSMDTLIRNEKEEFAIGDEMTVARLDSFGERMGYMLKYMPVDDWLNLYSRMFVFGMSNIYGMLLGNNSKAVDYSLKGFYPYEATDMTLTESEVMESYNTGYVSSDYRPENIEKFTAIIELCREYDARVIVAVVPVSDAMIIQNDGWDEFLSWTTDYCRDQGCEFYDLNLIANRYELFNDKTSFKDIDHMSDEGADVFTTVLCDVIKRADAGEDVSQYFYDSYEDMKCASPYMQYLVSG